MPDDDDFRAQMDLETLVNAREIEKDAARMAKAKDFAERSREKFARVADSLPGRKPRSFNGARK